jgi:hypothetical protein
LITYGLQWLHYIWYEMLLKVFHLFHQIACTSWMRGFKKLNEKCLLMCSKCHLEWSIGCGFIIKPWSVWMGSWSKETILYMVNNNPNVWFANNSSSFHSFLDYHLDINWFINQNSQVAQLFSNHYRYFSFLFIGSPIDQKSLSMLGCLQWGIKDIMRLNHL